ncbi:MAG: hypothetical protein AABX71_00715 [Nanoarchaeota archaeon]
MVNNTIIQQSRQIRQMPLCSRCMHHEVTSWMNDKWRELDEEVRKAMIEELKTIKLRNGECVVCRNNLVSVDTSERILKILEESNVPNRTKGEYRKFFCI